MTGTPTRVSPAWLRLREPTDAAARAADLVRAVREAPAGTPRVVHDLGCGSGAMGRWLAPLLGGPQHWVLHDRDPVLLRRARIDPPSVEGRSVTVETRCGDVTRLDPTVLAGASLVTASALLDLLTADELDRLVASCVASGAPVLLTLSVHGRVEIRPGDALDAVVGAAFDDHQRRDTPRGALLGPEAVRVAAATFHRRGCRVEMRPSPWRLGARTRSLTREWLVGWVGAAVEQRPELEGPAEDYLARRTEQLTTGRLRVAVPHLDLLAVPGGAR